MSIYIAPDAPYLRGHFPGRPILPGVVQLWLVVEHLVGEVGSSLFLRSIKFARLRQLVVPGDRLDVAFRPAADSYMRADITRSGVLVANAELEVGSGSDRQPLPRAMRVEGTAVAAPPLDLLLPHRPPMRFVTKVERELAAGLQCMACISLACGLASGGR